jgi:magnesium transporter
MLDYQEPKEIVKDTPKESLGESLQQVIALLEKHKLVEGLVHKQDMNKHELVEQLVHKQNLAELQTKLDALHSADVAHILEALPLEDRLNLWDLVKPIAMAKFCLR